MHRVDLNKNNIRMDLISDIEHDYSIEKYKFNNIIIEKTSVNKKNKKDINKSIGSYISIIFDDVTDSSIKEDLITCLSKELKNLLVKKNLFGKSLLIIGLGNKKSTPDSIGPKVIDNIIPTRHISIIDNLDKKYSVLSKISPGVFADTGIESFDIVKSIVNCIKPDYLIVIDSLSSKSLKKVNKVIQITDSGIDPGSGVGNHRKEISKKTLGIDVIAIGVPTVVNLNTIVKDILFDYDLEDILNNNHNNYLVTPKEIDFVIEQLAMVISKSINNVVHNLTK